MTVMALVAARLSATQFSIVWRVRSAPSALSAEFSANALIEAANSSTAPEIAWAEICHFVDVMRNPADIDGGFGRFGGKRGDPCNIIEDTALDRSDERNQRMAKTPDRDLRSRMRAGESLDDLDEMPFVVLFVLIGRGDSRFPAKQLKHQFHPWVQGRRPGKKAVSNQ